MEKWSQNNRKKRDARYVNEHDKQHDPMDLPGIYNIGILLTLTQRASANHYSALLEPLKLTPVQSHVLNMIDQETEMTVGSLATMYMVKAPVMTAIVEGLARLEYIERHPDPSDRRRNLLSITEAGRQIMIQLEFVRERMLEWMTAGLTEAEVHQLENTLRKMVTALEMPERLVGHLFDKE